MNDHDRFVEAAANTAHQRDAARLQAAAAEARELALREALEACGYWVHPLGFNLERQRLFDRITEGVANSHSLWNFIHVALSAPRDTAALDAMLENVRRETKDSLNEFHGRQIDALNAELAKARGDAADCAENHYTAEEGRALEAQVAAERLKTAAAQARIREMRTELEDRGCRREGRGCGLDSSSKLCSTCELIASPDDDDAELRAFGLRVAEAMREVSRKSGWLSHVGPVVESVLRGEGGT